MATPAVSVEETTLHRAASKDDTGRQYQRSFIVIMSEPPHADDALNARLAVASPYDAYLGAPHPADTYITCKGVEPRQRRDSRLVFDVIAYYDQHNIATEENVENPFLRSPDIGVDTADYTIPIERDLDENAIVNSVGQQFDPGLEITLSRPRLVWVQNEDLELFPQKVWDYHNTINNAPYQGAATGTLRVRMRATLVYERTETAVAHWRVRYELEYNDRAGVDDLVGWQTDGMLLDVGMQQYVDDGQGSEGLARIRTSEGEVIADPWPLDGAGHALTKEQIDAGEYFYWNHSVYRETNFGNLNLIGLNPP